MRNRLRRLFQIGRLLPACAPFLSINGCMCGGNAKTDSATRSTTTYTQHDMSVFQRCDPNRIDAVVAQRFRLGNVQSLFRRLTIYDKIQLGD